MDRLRADRLKSWIRQRMTGGCRMLSEGEQCACPLCDVDALVAAMDRLRALIATWQAKVQRRRDVAEQLISVGEHERARVLDARADEGLLCANALEAALAIEPSTCEFCDSPDHLLPVCSSCWNAANEGTGWMQRALKAEAQLAAEPPPDPIAYAQRQLQVAADKWADAPASAAAHIEQVIFALREWRIPTGAEALAALAAEPPTHHGLNPAICGKHGEYPAQCPTCEQEAIAEMRELLAAAPPPVKETP